MAKLEFAVKGPPASVNTKGKGPHQSKLHSQWRDRVRAAVRAQLPENWGPLSIPVRVEIVYFYVFTIKNVDNYIKPILDALGSVASPTESIVWIDDGLVYDLRSVRYCRREISIEFDFRDASDILLSALAEYGDDAEIVFVSIEWSETSL